MYAVYMHKYGAEEALIVGLFKRHENAEAYIQAMKNSDNGHSLYIIKHITTDF